MNYPIDVENWKNLVKNYATSLKDYHPNSGYYFVLNLDMPHEDFYGNGPTNIALARYDSKTEKWYSTQYEGEELSYHDFRDFNAHNVGGHDGKITHYFEDTYEFSCLLIELLIQLQAFKKALPKKKKKKQ